MQETDESTRGILNPRVGETKFQLRRYAPAPDLACFIEHYWVIHWDLQEPYVQETIPYPCVNLVMERDDSRVFGVVSGKFTRQLEGRGGVFSVKFRPGGFYPFVKWPISNLTDRSMPFEEAFGVQGSSLERAVLAASADEGIALMEAFIRERLPEQDEQIAFINQVVDAVVDDATIKRVDDLVSRFYVSKRTLQRLFSQYVGVSPKWVIQRYRLHEAAEQLADGEIADWTRLALELGYFDQAHFIKDFRMMIGTTPAAYARQADS